MTNTRYIPESIVEQRRQYDYWSQKHLREYGLIPPPFIPSPPTKPCLDNPEMVWIIMYGCYLLKRKDEVEMNATDAEASAVYATRHREVLEQLALDK